MIKLPTPWGSRPHSYGWSVWRDCHSQPRRKVCQQMACCLFAGFQSASGALGASFSHWRSHRMSWEKGTRNCLLLKLMDSLQTVPTYSSVFNVIMCCIICGLCRLSELRWCFCYTWHKLWTLSCAPRTPLGCSALVDCFEVRPECRRKQWTWIHTWGRLRAPRSKPQVPSFLHSSLTETKQTKSLIQRDIDGFTLNHKLLNDWNYFLPLMQQLCYLSCVGLIYVACIQHVRHNRELHDNNRTCEQKRRNMEQFSLSRDWEKSSAKKLR